MTSDTQTVHSFMGLLLNKVPEVTIYFWLIKVLSVICPGGSAGGPAPEHSVPVMPSA